MMMITANSTHHSKVLLMSENEVSFAAGSTAMTPVYTPAMTAKMMSFVHVRSMPPKSFFRQRDNGFATHSSTTTHP